MRVFQLTTLLVIALVFCAQQEEDPIVPSTSLKHLDTAARQLARAGEVGAVEKLLAVLARLQYGSDALRKLETECTERLSRRRPGATSLSGVARKLRFATREMADQLPELHVDGRRILAGILLGLDSAQPAVRKALGYAYSDGAWRCADWQELSERRAAIQTAVQSVLHLDFEFDTSPSDSALLGEVLGAPGTMVSWEALSFHSNLSTRRLERIVTDVLRGLALSNFLRTNRLAIPEFIWERDFQNFVILDSKDLYLQAVDYCVNSSLMTESEGSEARLLSAQFSSSGFCLNYDTTEPRIKASLFNFLGDFRDSGEYEGELNTCLYAGHMNWICLRLFGSSSPCFAWDEVNESNAGCEGPIYTARSTDEDFLARKALMRLTGSSLFGCRSWLIDLVERGTDPPWRQIVGIGEIERFSGVFLLKSTVVVEYLQEKGALNRMFETTARHESPGDSGRRRSAESLFEAALGSSIDEFDHRWRIWLLEHRPGLCQELDLSAASKKSREDEKLLACLNDIRQKAWNEESLGPYMLLSVDQALSRGARAHAAYLDKNPDQAALWPNCHEEYTGLDGYTAEGCWAGLHALIWPGSFKNRPERAVANWMGTFYHRLPLLKPGLFRVGWGAGRRNAVLDAETLVLPDDRPYAVLWPYHGMSGVPLGFAPEMPSPVPGEDQSSWGYPVTMQVYLGGIEPRYEMSLFVERTADDLHEVPCFFSTPARPTNPVLAPANAFCLIPKARLEPRTTYRVVARDLRTADEMKWQFKTE